MYSKLDVKSDLSALIDPDGSIKDTKYLNIDDRYSSTTLSRRLKSRLRDWLSLRNDGDT